MICPECKKKLPSRLIVRTFPIELSFEVGQGSDNVFRRTGDITAREVIDIERPTKDTHYFTCPSCSAAIDLTSIEVVPICGRCHKEKAKLTVVDNTCAYIGLVCIECARAYYEKDCVGCSRLKSCALGQRASKSTG